MPRSPSVPSYRLHRPSGQAVVTVRTAGGERRDLYLGVYNSPESRAEYARVIAETASSPAVNTAPGARITVDEMLLAFFKHAEQHYRRPDGTPTDRIVGFQHAARPLHRLYGHLPAESFGPLALRTVRQAYVDLGNARSTVNFRVGMVRHIFRWAASHELVPATVHAALKTVAGLEEGRSEAPETEPVGPAPDADVDAVLAIATGQIRGLIMFQRLTGCRPGEACALRLCDIDRTGPVWLFKPKMHKTRHKGKTRVIAIGPKAQEMLAPFLALTNDGGYVFTPRRVVGAKAAEKYSARVYAVNLKRRCARAGVPNWTANQVRHSYATKVRKQFGLEHAQVALGHAKSDVTERYAEKDVSLAMLVPVATV